MENTPQTIILSSNTYWSVWNFRRNLITSLIENGFEVCVLSAGNDTYREQVASINGVHIRDVYMDRGGSNPIKDILTFISYWNILRKEKPFAMLNFTAKPNIYGSLAAHFAHKNTRVINNISGLGSVFIHGGYKQRVVEWLYKHSQKYAYHVFFQNNDDKDLFLSRKLIKDVGTSVLPGSGVDLEKFKYSPHNADKITFVYIGRMTKEKGVPEFIEAATIVSGKYPDVQFILVGNTRDENPSALSKRQILTRIGENENITLVDQTDDILTVLQDSTCVVLPSHREGMSRTLLEACAVGRPIITTDVPGCRDVVEPEASGYLVPVKDSKALSEAIIRMINIGHDAQIKMGLVGRSRAENIFDEKKVINAYLEQLYTTK